MVLAIIFGVAFTNIRYGFLDNIVGNVFADEVEELQRQIDELENLKKLSEDATKPLEDEVNSLDKRIANARYSITKAKQEEEELAEQKK